MRVYIFSYKNILLKYAKNRKRSQQKVIWSVVTVSRLEVKTRLGIKWIVVKNKKNTDTIFFTWRYFNKYSYILYQKDHNFSICSSFVIGNTFFRINDLKIMCMMLELSVETCPFMTELKCKGNICCFVLLWFFF